MFGLQARTKQPHFLRLWKGEGDEPDFLASVKAKQFARGKAMSRRRLQRRFETKGRRLKQYHAHGGGRFMASWAISSERRRRPGSRSVRQLGYIISIVIYGVFFVFVSFHFSHVDNARLHLSIPCDVFGRLQVDAMFGYHGRSKRHEVSIE